MVRFISGLLLFTAFASAGFARPDKVSDQAQQVLHPESPQWQPGNPRKLKGRFLHITDVHPDPFYIPGSDSDGEHPCHRGKGNDVAGYYGAPVTSCDAPFTLVNATFEWIKDNIKDEIDFVVWTGDSARHDNDDSIPRSRKQIEDLNRYVVDKFVETFGKRDNIHDPDPTNDFVVPIVPTYGNNDVLPHNIFAPGPNAWTRSYGDIWRKFIPEEQKHSFARGGWFWIEVIPKKLAVISLNTLYFFQSNYAVDGCNLKSEPGYEHMEWLRIQLQFMRQRGLKAFLIGHVPPARTGSKQNWDESCYQKYVLWQRQYRDVIAGNFFGHMNVDHFMFHDVRDLVYKFHIDGIDDEGLRLGREATSVAEDHNIHPMAKATYLNELRSEWSDLPTPPKGVRYGSATDHGEGEETKKKKQQQRKDKDNQKQKERNNFLQEIGGPYGERFSMSIVSPSVVPNFFPSLRIIEYNVTGLEHDHPAVGSPKGHLATEKDLYAPLPRYTREQDDEVKDGMWTDNNDVDTDKKKKKKKKHKKKKGKHGKNPKVKPSFPVPAPPAKASPPGPAFSPQTFSLLSWTQLYANLTSIHQLMAAESPSSPGSTVEALRKYKHNHFDYRIEYTTKNDSLYEMPDLTVRHWLDLAERIGRTVYQKSDDGFDSDAQAPPSDSFDAADQTENTDDYSDVDGDIDESSKKKKKHKKHKKKSSKLKSNNLWHEFVRRAFVKSKADSDLEDDFG